MNYRILPPHLHSTADAAIRFFRNNEGVTGVQIETSIDNDIRFRPTIIGKMRDHHMLSVEVTDSGYTSALDEFVLDCERRGLPVRLYIAIPRGADLAEFQHMVKRAQNRGVGVVEVDERGGNVMFRPLSLSLTGVRRVNVQRFPMKYRQALSEAQQTFLGGDPVKGCGCIYDELESLSRRIAQRVDQRGLWKRLKGAQRRPKVNFEIGPWQRVLTVLREHFAYSKIPPGQARLNETLLAQVIGLTPYRNESGHKPRRLSDLISRDRQLRTRFEHAVDTLESLVKASKFLRV